MTAPHENECLPRCGLCCRGDVPIRTPDIDDLFLFLNTHRRLKALQRQLRFWGGDPRWCPLLTPDRRCFVYEGRPPICRVAVHVTPSACPKEAEGLVRFSKLPLDAPEVRAALEIGTARVTTMAIVGDLLRRTFKGGLSQTYPSWSAAEYVAKHLPGAPPRPPHEQPRA